MVPGSEAGDAVTAARPVASGVAGDVRPPTAKTITWPASFALAPSTGSEKRADSAIGAFGSIVTVPVYASWDWRFVTVTFAVAEPVPPSLSRAVNVAVWAPGSA